MSYEKFSLRVAVCTEAIIYLPFYLSYLSNDFKDNPFEDNIEVSIIDKDNDIFISSKSKLRGDDFVLFCLLFDIADVGICDPTILIHFFEQPNDFIEPLKKFKATLKDTDSSIYKSIENILSDNQICEAELNILKEQKTKIIGSLVSDLAVNFIVKKDVQIDSISSFNTHPAPSTLYYLLSEYTKSDTDFGKEISNWKELNDTSSIITCDMIVGEIFSSEEYQQIFTRESISVEILDIPKVKEKLIGDNSVNQNIVFTGIIANTHNNSKKNLLKSFLYSINKKLFKINTLLKYDRVGLKKYISHKLLGSGKNEMLVNELLFSNSDFYADFFKENNISQEERFNRILNFLIDKLIRLRKDGIHLFREDVSFDKQNLLPILSKRISTFDEKNIKSYIDLSYLKSWKRIDKKFGIIKNSFVSKLLLYPKFMKSNRKGAVVMYVSAFLIAFSFYFDFHSYQFGSTIFIESIKEFLWSLGIYPKDSTLYHLLPNYAWNFAIGLGIYILVGLILSSWFNKYEKFIYDD